MAVDKSQDLTPKDIIEIMEKSKKLGITKFSLGDLSFSFQDTAELQNNRANGKGKKLTRAEQEKIDELVVKKEELALRDEQIAMSMVENPELAEWMLLKGDLTDESGSDEFSDGDDE